MRNPTLRLLQVVLGFICAFHIFMGVGLMFSPAFQAWAASTYGARVDWTPQMVYMVRILGSFAFVLGLLALAAAINPLREQTIIYGFVVLFLLRDAHRLLFHAEIQGAFAVTSAVNWLTNAFLFAQTLLLLLLNWLVRRPARNQL